MCGCLWGLEILAGGVGGSGVVLWGTSLIWERINYVTAQESYGKVWAWREGRATYGGFRGRCSGEEGTPVM